MQKFFEILGWIGSFLILGAYFLIALEFIDSQNLLYALMNIFGSAFLAIDMFRKKAFSAFFLESVWMIIALISLVKIYAN